MKIFLRSGVVAAAVGVGLSLVALPSGPAAAAGGTHVPCNDIAALKNAITQANSRRRTHHPRVPLHLHPDHAGQSGRRASGDHRQRDHLRPRHHHPKGPGATQDFRILHVVAGGNLTLNSLTVSGGRLCCASGGGTRTTGHAEPEPLGHQAEPAFLGGGLPSDGGRLNLGHSTVERNSSYRFGRRGLEPGEVAR